MAIPEDIRLNDLSLSYRDPETGTQVSTAEVLKTMPYKARVDHAIAVAMGGWAAGRVFRLATPSEVTKHKEEHPKAYAVIQEQVELELASRGILPPPELSLAPPVAEDYEQPQTEPAGTRAA